ncbi:MAG: hypothetical protein GY861_29175 [bacterium]|nr:hypothetical protein [bacterium]
MKVRKYDSEKKLVDDFNRAYIKTLRKGRNVLILPEINTNWGIADILSIHYDKSKLTQRCKAINGTPLDFSNLSAYAMTYLSETPIAAVEDLSNYLKVKNGPLIQVIDILTSRGLVYVYKNGRIRARKRSKAFVIKDILAFEAKISNWKKAIDQAERHLWFTNSSFVVVPNLTRSTIDKINIECSGRGIGLIIQSGNKSFKIIKEPLRKSRIDSFFSWKLNELLIDRSISNGRCNPSETP